MLILITNFFFNESKWQITCHSEKKVTSHLKLTVLTLCYQIVKKFRRKTVTSKLVSRGILTLKKKISKYLYIRDSFASYIPPPSF